jgi:hypothetical protein
MEPRDEREVTSEQACNDITWRLFHPILRITKVHELESSEITTTRQNQTSLEIRIAHDAHLTSTPAWL